MPRTATETRQGPTRSREATRHGTQLEAARQRALDTNQHSPQDSHASRTPEGINKNKAKPGQQTNQENTKKPLPPRDETKIRQPVDPKMSLAEKLWQGRLSRRFDTRNR